MISIDSRQLVATIFYDSGNTEYTFNFDYLLKKFVCIKYVSSMESDDIDEGTPLVYGKDYTVDDKRVVLQKPDTTKDLICIYRQTPTDNIVVFEDNSILKAKDFNIYDTQNLHLNEELSDYLILHKVSSRTINSIFVAVDEAQSAVNNAHEAANNASNSASNAQNSADKAYEYAQDAKDFTYNHGLWVLDDAGGLMSTSSSYITEDNDWELDDNGDVMPKEEQQETESDI